MDNEDIQRELDEGNEVSFDPTLLIAALVEVAGGEVEIARELLEGKGLTGRILVLEESFGRNTVTLRIEDQI